MSGKTLSDKTGFLIGAAIGSGSTALAAERGGADFLLAINAGRLRAMGAPSIACMLPIFDANRQTRGFAEAELLAQCRVPVLLGCNVWDADFIPDELASDIAEAGFAGITNFPSCMHYSRPMQQLLSRAGRGIEAEVALMRAAQDRGLTAMFYCATRTQARLAADAGIAFVCLNLGWNVGGSTGHRRRASLEEVATVAQEIGRLVRRISPATRFLLEGGPIETAEDLSQVNRLTEIDGYVGGSTFERMPLEASIADQIDRFRSAGASRIARDAPTERLLSWGRQKGLRGRSPAMISFLRKLRQVQDTDGPVLLLCERGSQESAILAALRRSDTGDTVGIDVAGEEHPGRARTLLFGHRDAMDRRRPGLADPDVGLLTIRNADRLPIAVQRRLGRALTDGAFRAPGTWRRLPVLPRVVLIHELRPEHPPSAPVAALDTDLLDALGGSILRMPPLRERIDDLFDVLDDAAAPLGRPDFTAAAVQRLSAHAWPGNEAELRAVFADLAGEGRPGPIPEDAVAARLAAGSAPAGPGGYSVRGGEKERILDALWRNGFNRTRTAEALGVSRKTLYNKIRRHGLSG